MSVYLLYDERMELHKDLNAATACMQPERPERAAVVYSALSTLTNAFVSLDCQQASEEQILRVHSARYLEKLQSTSEMSTDELIQLPTIDFTTNNSQMDNDLYFSHDTYLASTLAAGGVIACVNAVLEGGPIQRAIAIVRPPGHHCLCEKAMGFCFLNHVVIAAQEALTHTNIQRVVILDWDIHHGNGTQSLTYEEERILYISIHRYTGSRRKNEFFPGSGAPTEVGGNTNMKAQGTNVNVAWTKQGMGGVEYAASFCELILPIICSFQPDLILVSCGLDAAKGDLIGDCCLIPSDYYLLTKSILASVGTPMVQVFEGGYNLNVIGECMRGIALAMLDSPFEEPSNQDRVPDQLGNVHLEALPQDRHVFTLNDMHTPVGRCCLDQGKDILSRLWDHKSEDNRCRGIMDKSSIDDLNRTIRALRKCHIWKDTISLPDVPLQYASNSVSTRRQKPKADMTLDEALAALKI